MLAEGAPRIQPVPRDHLTQGGEGRHPPRTDPSAARAALRPAAPDIDRRAAAQIALQLPRRKFNALG